jgi:hypothetical protein
MKKLKPTKILDAMVAVVLAYRPKPKSKPAKKRKKRAAKIAKERQSATYLNTSYVNIDSPFIDRPSWVSFGFVTSARVQTASLQCG